MTSEWEPVDTIGRPDDRPRPTAEALAEAFDVDAHGFAVANHWGTEPQAFLVAPSNLSDVLRQGPTLRPSGALLARHDPGGGAESVYVYRSRGGTVGVRAGYFRAILPRVLAGSGCERPDLVPVEFHTTRRLDHLFELGASQPYVRDEPIDMGAVARGDSIGAAFARLDGMTYAPLPPGGRAWNGDGVPYPSVAAALDSLDRAAAQASGPQAVIRGAQSSMRGPQSGERVAVGSASRLAAATSVAATSPATPPPALSVMRPIGGRRMRIVE